MLGVETVFQSQSNSYQTESVWVICLCGPGNDLTMVWGEYMNSNDALPTSFYTFNSFVGNDGKSNIKNNYHWVFMAIR